MSFVRPAGFEFSYVSKLRQIPRQAGLGHGQTHRKNYKGKSLVFFKIMSSQRHLQRIALVQTLFESEFRENGKNPKEVLRYNLKEFGNKIKDSDFAASLLEGVFANLTEIRRVIAEKAPEWPVEKISPIDRAILEVGVFEIMFSKDVPPVVAIDEAIEIAKSYGGENSPKFVNGVLSSVMQSYKKT